MRRKDREVASLEGMLGIVGECKVCRIACMDGGGLYIVPLNFGYECEDGKLSLYVHSAKEGRKVDAFRQNPNVAFEMDCGHALVEGKEAGHYTYRYKSVTGNGAIRLLTDIESKKKGLALLMRHQAGRDFDIDDQTAGSTNVYKLEVTNITGKQNV